jgi:hypothetical protein
MFIKKEKEIFFLCAAVVKWKKLTKYFGEIVNDAGWDITKTRMSIGWYL